jgi:hypothetical protein
MAQMTNSIEPTCSCKIGRLLEKYDIRAFDGDLQEQWLNEKASLRDLARQFNERILREAIEAAGGTPMGGEVENFYRLLTDDDVSVGMQTQARNRLQSRGVDPDELESEFVSYQTVNRHLKNCHELERGSTQEEDVVDRVKDRIFALQSRTTTVTENALEQLQRADEIDVRNPSAFVEITVVCDDCGTVLTLDEALAGASCACDDWL